MRLWGINPTNSIFYSPEPHAEVYCLRLNINIWKLGYFYRKLKVILMFGETRSN